jgi:5'-3' exonuclease
MTKIRETPKDKVVALVDCDLLRYQCGSIQFEHPYLEDAKIPCPAEFVHSQTKLIIDRCLEVTDADDFMLVFTGRDNFRNEIAKEQPYKGNRDGLAKPYHWSTVSNYIMDNYGRRVVTCQGYEADDYISFHRERDDPEIYVICTRDKDLNTVEGWHYRWACGKSQPEILPYNITVYDAHSFFFLQCLTGDPTDNIPGCGRKEEIVWGGKNTMRRKGVGPKKAIGLLNGADTLGDKLKVVREQYEERFEGEDWEAILLENARLLYMGGRKDHLFEWDWLSDVMDLKGEGCEQGEPE